MSDPIRIAVVGVGAIARAQHLPAIAASAQYALAAVVSRTPDPARLADEVGAPVFGDIDALLDAQPDLAAVSLCTPPQGRHLMARRILARGRHVMLEKPPGASLSEVHALGDLAAAQGLALMATWHSRHGDAVEAARGWLAGRTVRAARIDWREDVRRWHPGQQWIWQPGGMGVFDPGINALSILTHILPLPVHVEGAVLEVPANRQAPIAAAVRLRDAGGAPIAFDLDWRQDDGRDVWDIVVETDGGTLTLSHGGARLAVNGQAVAVAEGPGEYPDLYARFAQHVAARTVDLDLAPLRLVADAFLCGERRTTAPFED